MSLRFIYISFDFVASFDFCFCFLLLTSSSFSLSSLLLFRRQRALTKNGILCTQGECQWLHTKVFLFSICFLCYFFFFFPSRLLAKLLASAPSSSRYIIFFSSFEISFSLSFFSLFPSLCYSESGVRLHHHPDLSQRSNWLCCLRKRQIFAENAQAKRQEGPQEEGQKVVEGRKKIFSDFFFFSNFLFLVLQRGDPHCRVCDSYVYKEGNQHQVN